MAERTLEPGSVSIPMEETKLPGGAPQEAPLLTHLKKVENHITEAQRFSHLPRRSAVDLEFNELSYTIREGPWWRRRGTTRWAENTVVTMMDEPASTTHTNQYQECRILPARHFVTFEKNIVSPVSPGLFSCSDTSSPAPSSHIYTHRHAFLHVAAGSVSVRLAALSRV